MVCPHCRTPNPDGTNLCVQCSTPIDWGQATLDVDALAGTRPDVTASTAWSDLGTHVDRDRGASSNTMLVPGNILGGRYEILKLLGEGGMGSVYRARDQELDRVVALKVIRPELARNAQVLHRFKQELILARQITHRNVIRIFDLGTADGTRYITMEYIEGEDLSSVLTRRGKLPAPEAAAIIGQACRGLEAAHAEGVVHRDLKPQNIMIDQQGKVSVMDFGIARSMDTSSMTRTGALLGTPTYMSPEQAQGHKVDARSDLYTLGIIFYELLAGKPPFTADHPMATLVRRIQEKPQPPIEIEPSIPRPLNDMVLKMLGTKVEERYQTAGEILRDLESWEAARTGRTQMVQPVRGGRMESLPTKLLAGALGLMLIIVAWLYWRKGGPDTPAAPTRRVSVLVADFLNRTGEPVFDGTLEPAVGLALEGAPFVSAFSRVEARREAREQAGSERLDRTTALLVAKRMGIDVVVDGSIAARNGEYQINLAALNSDGKTLVDSGASAGKQDVLAQGGKLTVPIRKKLGDDSPERATETYTSSSLEAAQAYAKGQELQFAGKYDLAIQLYQQAVQIDPNMGRALAGLAVAHANLDQFQEADQYFQKALAGTGRMTDREGYRTRGAYYLLRRNPEKAIEEFNKLVQAYPADDAGQTNLALAHFYARNLAKAVEEGGKAIALNPNNLNRNNFALYAMYGGHFDDAIRGAAEVLKNNAQFHKAYVATALALLAQGKPVEAEQTYQKLAGIDARGASMAAMGLADLRLYEGRAAEASALLEKAVAADLELKANSRAASKLAALATAERNRAKAVELANRALALSVNPATRTLNEGAAFPAARVLLENGQEAAALKVAADMAVRLEPDPQAYARLLRGEVELRKGRAREAVVLFEEAKKLADTWIGRLDLARGYIEAGLFAEASSELDACLKRKGEATAAFLDDVPSLRYFPDVYYYLGRAQEGLKSPSAAESYRTFLKMKTAAEGADPLVLDARKRVGAL